jgi:transglutaminase-like putative cysteine protease
MRRSFHRSGARLFVAAFAVAALLFSSCGLVERVFDGAINLARERPTRENTLTDPVAYTKAIADAIQAGEDAISLNLTASDEDLRDISNHIDPFWGTPVSYLVNREWGDMALTDTGPAIDVRTVEFALEQSVSYYAYMGYVSGGAVEPPSGIADDVSAVSRALPGIVSEIEASLAGADGTDYDKALAVHDWLVRNIEYNARMNENSDENGVAGAVIGRSTMCQGYAEAFELLLRCISEADVRLVVGDGSNEGSSFWVEHAWNLVNLDGAWRHVDATFDDPVNSDRDAPSHIYFGRTDAGMRADHRWNAEYWPAAGSEDFLYYRDEGLYAKNKKELRSIVKRALKRARPAEIEIAVGSVDLAESDLLFVYGSSADVSGVMYSFTRVEGVTIVNLQLKYGR